MMSLRLRTTPLATRAPQAACTTRPAHLSRRSSVQVRADWFSEAFTRVFTPNKDDMPRMTVDYTGKGRPRGGGRKPFKDNFAAGKAKPQQQAPPVVQAVEAAKAALMSVLPTNGKGKAEEAAAAAAAAAEEAADEAPENPFTYVAQALRRVMSNNFTSEEGGRSTGQAGWKGNVRQRRRKDKGFHNNMY